jgi:AraC family transcriptional regulator of arabinose operon
MGIANGMDWRVQEIVRQLRQSGTVESRLGIDHLAGSVNLSASRLRHLFKAETGMGLKKCLIELRLERGKELLENSLLSVKEISVRVGYLHESHFVRDFKRSYQATPAHYRRQRRSRDIQRNVCEET